MKVLKTCQKNGFKIDEFKTHQLHVDTKKERFHRRSQRGDLGEIKVFEFRRCSQDLLPLYYVSRGRNFSYFGFIPTFGLILGLIVGWFYAVFVALIGRILWPMEKGCFRDGFKSKRRVLELPRSSLARYSVARLEIAALEYAIA